MNSAARQRSRGRATVIRVAGGGVAVLSLLGIVNSVGATSASAEQKVHKSYVCKYVDKPGEAERLQTGNNPIWVDNHALLGYDGDTYVGQEFKDRQGRSVVIVANTPKLNPEPSVADCPPPNPPTSTTTTSTMPPTSTTTTSTMPPTSTTTTSTMPPTSTTTTSTSTTTWATLVPPTSASSTTTPGTYPLQPVNAGAGPDTPAWTVLTRWGLLGVALLGLLALATGGRLPRLLKLGNREK